MSKLVVVGATLIALAGCKKTGGVDAGSSSGLQSVAIQVPAQVAGKVSMAQLVAGDTYVGQGRTFEEAVTAAASGGSSVNFQRDKKNENIKIGDNLYSVTLNLMQGSTIVYTGKGSIDPFIIKAGENRIAFSLTCQDKSVCPTGSNLQVVQVQGVSADAASAPKILADITVSDSGLNVPQRRQLLSDCRAQVLKKTCEQWQLENAKGAANCKSIRDVDAAGVCEGAGTVRTCLDDYIVLCQELGVISK